MTTKLCGVCKQQVSFALFSKNRASSDGLFSRCKPCCHIHDTSPEQRARQRAYQNTPAAREKKAVYREKNVVWFTRWNVEARLKKLYGIDSEDLARLFEKQSGVCACCPKLSHYGSSARTALCRLQSGFRSNRETRAVGAHAKIS